MRLEPRHGATDARLAALSRFAVAGARGDAAAARRAVLAARGARVARRAVEETGLMLVLYAGYPAALETMRVVHDAWPGRPRRSREGGPSRWRRRGTALCRRVYGPLFRRLVVTVRGFHPDLAAWMVETGYGRVLSRPGLSAVARELITVAVLAATDRERQLVSHLLGAARVGAALRRALGLGARSRRERATARRAWRAAFGPGVDPTRTSP
jgi:alkylhydroperoxidase/carboxymuconolactone decarboxylase family protein YurZ